MIPELLVTDLLISLITEASVALLSHGLGKASQAIRLRKDLNNSAKLDKTLSKTIHTVLGKISGDTPFLKSDPNYERLRQFLVSPTAENIVMQIFLDSMEGKAKRKSTVYLREEFRICLAQYLGLSAGNVEDLATGLFDIIHLGCTRLLSRLTSENVLMAHEALSTARHRFIIDELQVVRSKLEFLTSGDVLDLSSILEFEKKYREQVGDRCRQVTVPHFDRATRINIDKIFVPPNISTSHDRIPTRSGGWETMQLNDFLIRIYRTVLVGDPGSGKSILAQKICHDLSEKYDDRIVSSRDLTPVLIVLRDFAARKREKAISILQFIESEVTSKYQMPREPPSRAFEYLLHNGYLLVIFDGLDELLDATDRRVMVEDIESFCNLFPSTPVLVTSRVVGYEKAPLDSSVFEIFHIDPFNVEQVEDYSKKWFSTDLNFSPEEQKRHALSFSRESEIAPDLRSNPLLLALMCNLYRGIGYIPHNRPEVYRKCAEMLFERWDQSRGLWVQRAAVDLKNLLSDLAYWMYTSEGHQQGGVKEKELISQSTKLLYPSRFETKEEAEAASHEFIKFCQGRAWVFTDVGTTPDGQFLYKFTHKTFLEYFTAANLVRKYHTPIMLWGVLSPRIAKGEWDVVAQLAFQMLNEQVDSASDDLLALLLHAAERADVSIFWSYLWFGARSLQFIAPSPRSVRTLTEYCLKVIVETGQTGVDARTSTNKFLVGPAALMKALMVSVQECRSTIADCISNTTQDHAKNSNDKVALAAIDLALSMPYPLKNDDESYRSWEECKLRIAQTSEVRERLEKLAHDHFLALLLWFHIYPNESIEALPKWHTLDDLYTRPASVVYPEFRNSSIADFIVAESVNFGHHIGASAAHRLRTAREAATMAGRIIMSTPMPCFSQLEPFEGFEYPVAKEGSMSVSVTGEAFFGLCCIVIASIEAIAHESHVVSDCIIPMSRLGPVFSPIASMIQVRKNFGIGTEKIALELRRFRLSPNARDLLIRWVTTSRFRFCAPHGAKTNVAKEERSS